MIKSYIFGLVIHFSRQGGQTNEFIADLFLPDDDVGALIEALGLNVGSGFLVLSDVDVEAAQLAGVIQARLAVRIHRQSSGFGAHLTKALGWFGRLHALLPYRICFVDLVRLSAQLLAFGQVGRFLVRGNRTSAAGVAEVGVTLGAQQGVDGVGIRTPFLGVSGEHADLPVDLLFFGDGDVADLVGCSHATVDANHIVGQCSDQLLALNVKFVAHFRARRLLLQLLECVLHGHFHRLRAKPVELGPHVVHSDR